MCKVCSFFGHRNASLTSEQYEKLKDIIEDLIVNKNVKVFLFGSRSNFDCICHKIVTNLKQKYPNIIRKAYTCKSEACILEAERAHYEKLYSNLYKEKVNLLGVEENVNHKTKYSAGRASYIERNYAMINDSDYCIFYFDPNYKPNPQEYYKSSYFSYQPKSGTSLAYTYAKQKHKIIINLLEL